MTFTKNRSDSLFIVIPFFGFLLLIIGLILGNLNTIESIKDLKLYGILIGFMLIINVVAQLFIRTSKITIDKSGIYYKSLIKEFFISWERISEIGYYISYGSMTHEIGKDDLHKYKPFGVKMLFLACNTIDKSFLTQKKINKEYIQFEYREEVLLEIEKYLNN